MARGKAVKRKFDRDGPAPRRMKAPRLHTYRPPSGMGVAYTPSTIEKKFYDQDVTDAVVAAGGTIVQSSLVTIAQGTTESTRIGRKVNIRGVYWKYTVDIPPASGGGGGTGDTVRVILYQDKQTNGAAAGITDIVESADYQSFYNLSNIGRFDILMDRTHALNPSAGAGNGTANDFGEVTHSYKFGTNKLIPIEYNSTTGALTEVRSNNLGVLLLGRAGVAGFTSKMRIRYTD